MGKACNTQVARSLGYMGRLSEEDKAYTNPVSIMGPSTGTMTSYHQSGKSSKELYLESRRAGLLAAECLRKEFRL